MRIFVAVFLLLVSAAFFGSVVYAQAPVSATEEGLYEPSVSEVWEAFVNDRSFGELLFVVDDPFVRREYKDLAIQEILGIITSRLNAEGWANWISVMAETNDESLQDMLWGIAKDLATPEELMSVVMRRANAPLAEIHETAHYPDWIRDDAAEKLLALEPYENAHLVPRILRETNSVALQIRAAELILARAERNLSELRDVVVFSPDASQRKEAWKRLWPEISGKRAPYETSVLAEIALRAEEPYRQKARSLLRLRVPRGTDFGTLNRDELIGLMR